MGIDVTAHRVAEQSFSALHQQRQLILGSAGDGTIGLNRAGRCTFINQSVLEILFFQRAELEGEKFHDLVLNFFRTREPLPERNSPVFQAHRHGRRFRGKQGPFWGVAGIASEVE